MTSTFSALDYAIFIGYAILILGVGLWVSRDKKGHQKNAEDYFLASKSLPWWAVGASLIAANISAEQFIGMSGSGFKIGLAIASYEWMAALTLIIVGKADPQHDPRVQARDGRRGDAPQHEDGGARG